MTTDREQIIAAAKEVNAFFNVIAYGRHDGTLFSTNELERFYAIAHEAGRVSRDAEIASLRADAERYRFIRDNPWNGTELEGVIKCHLNAVWDLSIDEAIRARSTK